MSFPARLGFLAARSWQRLVCWRSRCRIDPQRQTRWRHADSNASLVFPPRQSRSLVGRSCTSLFLSLRCTSCPWLCWCAPFTHGKEAASLPRTFHRHLDGNGNAPFTFFFLSFSYLRLLPQYRFLGGCSTPSKLWGTRSDGHEKPAFGAARKRRSLEPV